MTYRLKDQAKEALLEELSRLRQSSMPFSVALNEAMNLKRKTTWPFDAPVTVRFGRFLLSHKRTDFEYEMDFVFTEIEEVAS